ncbi:hypothetical protein [Actinotalea sp.]|uniref:hypothetical protein n=1 Tax=Actinotalea sp. TaxID=1872145 RepID=UPI003566031D
MTGTDPVARIDAEDLADRIARATLSVPGVRRLHGGGYGEVGTYLAGRRIVGVRTGPRGTEVHVVVSAEDPVPRTVARLRRALDGVAPGPIHIHVEDLQVHDDE